MPFIATRCIEAQYIPSSWYPTLINAKLDSYKLNLYIIRFSIYIRCLYTPVLYIICLKIGLEMKWCFFYINRLIPPPLG